MKVLSSLTAYLRHVHVNVAKFHRTDFVRSFEHFSVAEITTSVAQLVCVHARFPTLRGLILECEFR